MPIGQQRKALAASSFEKAMECVYFRRFCHETFGVSALLRAVSDVGVECDDAKNQSVESVCQKEQ